MNVPGVVLARFPRVQAGVLEDGRRAREAFVQHCFDNRLAARVEQMPAGDDGYAYVIHLSAPGIDRINQVIAHFGGTFLGGAHILGRESD